MSKREIILDTETTGLDVLDGHRIIEIGALELIDNKLTEQQFHFYINPERSVSPGAYKVHGLSTEFLQDKPLFRDIADDFLAFIADSDLVIHNAPFDLKFLNHELSLLGLPSIISSRAIDTVVMARKLFPGSRVSLDALCKRYSIDNSHRSYHGALKDCHLLYHVYIELTGGKQKQFDIVKALDSSTEFFAQVNDYITQQSGLGGQKKGNQIVVFPSTQELTSYANFIKKIRP
jgi:DNA polymerase-3 subunit epsilon